MNTKKIIILEESLGTFYKSKNEYLFFCPFCKHHKKKMSLNLSRGVFKCWVCDTKGGISYLIKRFGTQDNKYKWELLNQEIDMSSIQTMFEIKIEEIKQTVPLPEGYLCLAKKGLPYSAKEPLTYLMGRGLSRRDILYYKIGYCERGPYRNRIIIPSFNEDGNCNYFIARTYRTDWMRYKNPPVPKNIIFNDLLIDWQSPVTLVEGVFDAIKINNAIPILGSILSEKTQLFKKLVTEQPKIYVGLDHDVISKSLKVISTMIEYGLKVYRLDTSEIEDIGSVTKQEAEGLKENSILMNVENMLKIHWRN
jgi:DNA primase